MHINAQYLAHSRSSVLQLQIITYITITTVYVVISPLISFYYLFTENPYRQLPCNCHGSMPGKTAIELGPLWYVPKRSNVFRVYACIDLVADF